MRKFNRFRIGPFCFLVHLMTEEKQNIVSGVFFSSLVEADELADKPFDAITSGTFISMMGRKFTIKSDWLSKIVENTRKVIESTRGESGELAGLAIDSEGHNHDGVAGSIVSVELDNGMIRATPRWTEIGRDLLGKRLRRHFSVTIDLEKLVILGGSLTNWPLTRNINDQSMLLRPVELSTSLHTFDPEQIPEINGGPVLATDNDINHEGEPDELAENQEVIDMTPEELQAMLNAAIAPIQAQVAELSEKVDVPAPPAQKDDPEPPTTDPIDITSLVNLGGMDEKTMAAIEQLLEARHAELQTQAQASFAKKMAELSRKQEVSEFVANLCNATDGRSTALNENPDELQAALLELGDQGRKYWSGLLERVTAGTAIVDFGEKGHGREIKGGTEQLPDYIAAQLDAGDLKVADLGSSTLAPMLGDISRFDLSKWQDAAK